MSEQLFKVQHLNPVSHLVINTGLSAVVYRNESYHNVVMVCDLLNQVDLCNKRIALFGSFGNDALPPKKYIFLTEYYRATRTQALNVLRVVAGEVPVVYCEMCRGQGSKVQANHKNIYGDHGKDFFLCDMHKEMLISVSEHDPFNFERIW